MKIKHVVLLVLFSLFFIYTDKAMALTEAEKLSVAKAALSQLPANTLAGYQITRVALSNLKYQAFKIIKKNVNGVNVSVLPMKVTGNVLYEANAALFLSHGTIQGEATVHAYKNEVNDLTYEVVNMKAIKTEAYQDQFPLDIRNSAKSFTGKIKHLDNKNGGLESIEIENGTTSSLIGCIPNTVAGFINEKVKIGDSVKAYYNENGPHACNYMFIYEIDKL